MKVILLISRKGGSGKTTICKHLAVELSKTFRNVAVIDLDPQGSLTKWYDRRSRSGYDRPVLVNVDLEDLKGELDKLEGMGGEIAIIDCPGAFVNYLKKAIQLCDFAIIPTKPTNDDLEFANENLEIIEQISRPEGRGACKTFFVINEATPSDKFVMFAHQKLAQLVPVLGIVNRTNLFAKASLAGQVIGEMPAGVRRQVKAVKQIEDIAKALLCHIKKG
jgi:chromosome partitioning protein